VWKLQSHTSSVKPPAAAITGLAFR
jgi:hypothetical protein